MTRYRIAVATDDKKKPKYAHVYLYGLIGAGFFDDEGISASQFVADLAALPESVETIVVHLNSPGGNAFDGVAMANALRSHPARVEVRVEALAASAASVVAMAGDDVVIHENALLMLHNPAALTLGDAVAHRKTAEALDTVRDALVTSYQWHTPLDREAIIALMDAETWLDASAAVEKGFATRLADAVEPQARFAAATLQRFLGAKVPQAYQPRIAALTLAADPPPLAVLRACAEAGLPLEFAREQLEAGAPLGAVHAKIAETVAARGDATASEVLAACDKAGVLFLAQGLLAAHVSRGELGKRIAYASEIRALCKTAKLDGHGLAERWIADGLSVPAVKATLTVVTGLMDKAEIDTTLAPSDGGHAAQQGWDRAIAKVNTTAAAIYAARSRAAQ